MSTETAPTDPASVIAIAWMEAWAAARKTAPERWAEDDAVLAGRVEAAGAASTYGVTAASRSTLCWLAARTEPMDHDLVEATPEVIAHATGRTVDQVAAAIGRLLADGWLELARAQTADRPARYRWAGTAC